MPSTSTTEKSNILNSSQNAANQSPSISINDYDWSQSLLNEKIEKNIRQQKQSQRIIYALLALLLLALMAIIFLIQIPKRQPFIVMLNQQGQIEKTIDLEKNLSTSQVLAIEQYQIIDGLKNLLSVSSDKNLQKIRLEKGINYILPNSAAEKTIKEFLNQEPNNPYLLQKKYTVQLEVKNIKPIKSLKSSSAENVNNAKRFYQIQFKRDVYDLNQNLVESKSYEIITSHVFAKSKNEASIYKNPLGIFIDTLEINPIIEVS
jgi:type IV secretory pathway TrbF-like protein